MFSSRGSHIGSTSLLNHLASGLQNFGYNLCQIGTVKGVLGALESSIRSSLYCILLIIVYIFERFTAAEILELVNVLGIPEKIVTEARYKFTGIEALCLLLARFRSSGEIYILTLLYCRSASAVSQIVNELCLGINDIHGHIFSISITKVL